MNIRLLTSVAAFAAGFGLAGAASAAITIDGDPVLYWNDLAVKTVGGAAPNQARVIAMMNTAMHDAINRTYNGADNYYNVGVNAPGGNLRAAAAVAAHDVLVAVNPSQAASYDNALASSLSLIGAGSAKTSGMATGAAYAQAMITARANDGSGTVVNYVPGNQPGQWRPTPPGLAAPVLPQWGGVTPFLLSSGSQYRPAPPPALGSAEYLAAYNEVKEIGALNSATRTQDQKESALFWDVSNGTTWIRIGVDVIADDGLSSLESARVMAKLSTAVADSFISVWDAKYTYNFWRPVTAIREGDSDGVADTLGDANWSPLFATPAHPSYAAAHAIQSAAAAGVLLDLVADQAFCNTIAGDTRCFTSIGQAAQDAGYSRLWGGIHWRFDVETGLAMGDKVGKWTLAQGAFNAVPEPASWAMMIAGFGLAGTVARRRRVMVAYA